MTLAPMPAARVSARVDTLVVRVELPGPLHSATLHDRLAAEIGSAITVKPDNAIGRWKTVRVQDLTPARVALLIERLGAAAEIKRLDVAVDWHLTRQPDRTDEETSAALDELFASIARSFAPPAEDLAGAGRPRQANRETSKVHALAQEDNWPRQIAPDGGTTYFGARSAGVRWGVYRKVEDERKPLALDRQHARVELRLSGDGLSDAGLACLGDLAGFGFDGLARHFRFANISAPPLAPGELGDIIYKRLLDYRPHHLAAGAWSVAAKQRVNIKALNGAAQKALKRLARDYRPDNYLRTFDEHEFKQAAGLNRPPYSYSSYNTHSASLSSDEKPMPHHPADTIEAGSLRSPANDQPGIGASLALATLTPRRDNEEAKGAKRPTKAQKT